MTEKWTRLTYADLSEVLAYDEIEKLDSISISADIEDICQKQIDSCADSFRGAFQAKGYNIDVRDHYVPNAYRIFVLSLARYYICARFPGSKDIFLDEPRYNLYKRALELLDNPIIGTPDPDYSDDPELSGNTNAYDDVALTLPFQRLITRPLSYGFVRPYIEDYQVPVIHKR